MAFNSQPPAPPPTTVVVQPPALVANTHDAQHDAASLVASSHTSLPGGVLTDDELTRLEREAAAKERISNAEMLRVKAMQLQHELHAKLFPHQAAQTSVLPSTLAIASAAAPQVQPVPQPFIPSPAAPHSDVSVTSSSTVHKRKAAAVAAVELVAVDQVPTKMQCKWHRDGEKDRGNGGNWKTGQTMRHVRDGGAGCAFWLAHGLTHDKQLVPPVVKLPAGVCLSGDLNMVPHAVSFPTTGEFTKQRVFDVSSGEYATLQKHRRVKVVALGMVPYANWLNVSGANLGKVNNIFIRRAGPGWGPNQFKEKLRAAANKKRLYWKLTDEDIEAVSKSLDEEAIDRDRNKAITPNWYKHKAAGHSVSLAAAPEAVKSAAELCMDYLETNLMLDSETTPKKSTGYQLNWGPQASDNGQSNASEARSEETPSPLHRSLSPSLSLSSDSPELTVSLFSGMFMLLSTTGRQFPVCFTDHSESEEVTAQNFVNSLPDRDSLAALLIDSTKFLVHRYVPTWKKNSKAYTEFWAMTKPIFKWMAKQHHGDASEHVPEEMRMLKCMPYATNITLTVTTILV